VSTAVEGQILRARALESLGRLPPFSPILNRLLASLASEDVSFVRIADTIEKDTVLAGNVLRLVNSALYGRSATINSVRHAVSLLGVNKLRNATLSMSVTRMWNQVQVPRGWSMARFNLHSVATAMVGDVVAQAAPINYAEGAFAAGLFHDLGRLLMAIALPAEYEQITMLSTSRHFARWECEMEVVGFTHAELSSDALQQWNLPAEICHAVFNHHTPERDHAPEGQISLSRAIGAVDAYANANGYALSDTDTGDKERATAMLIALGIDEASLPVLLESFTAEFAAIRSMF
jgi:HD-like signal output (HDOD) protein